MKAKEAPEKLYFFEGEPILSIRSKQREDANIEYTRTDAFIEKVSDWLKDCATFTDMNGKKHIDKEMYKTTFDDFVNYVKEK